MQQGRGLFVSMLDRYQNVTLVIDAPENFPAEAFAAVENGDLDPAGLNFICRFLLKVKHTDKESDSFFPGQDQARYLLMEGDRCDDVKIVRGSRGLFLLDPTEEKMRRIWVSGVPTEIVLEALQSSSEKQKKVLEASIFTTPMLPAELGWLWIVAEKDNPCPELGDLRVFMISPDVDLVPADVARFGADDDLRRPRRRSIGVIARSSLRRHKLFTAAGQGCLHQQCSPDWDHIIAFQGRYVLIDTAQPDAVSMSIVLRMMGRPVGATTKEQPSSELRIRDMVASVLGSGTAPHTGIVIQKCSVFSQDAHAIGALAMENARDDVRCKKVTVLLLEDIDPAILSPWVRRRRAKYLFVLGQDAFPFLGTEPVEHLLRWKQHACTWAHVLIDKCKRCREPCGLWALACPVCFGTMCYACVPGTTPGRHASAMCASCRVGRILFPKRRMLVDCNDHDMRTLSAIAYRQTHFFECQNCGKPPSKRTYCSEACRECVWARTGSTERIGCEACELARRRTYACDCLEHPHYCSVECARAHRPVHRPFCTNRPVEAWHEDLRRHVRMLSPWGRHMVLRVMPRDSRKKSAHDVQHI